MVCDWIGNTEAIASKHYLQVTDDHFSKAVRNPVQQPAVLPRTGPQVGLAEREKTPVLQGNAGGRDHPRDGQVPPAGIEQKPFSSGRVQVSETAGAKSGAVDRENVPIDPDLATVTDAWLSLPPDTRTAILAIVAAAHRR